MDIGWACLAQDPVAMACLYYTRGIEPRAKPSPEKSQESLALWLPSLHQYSTATVLMHVCY